MRVVKHLGARVAPTDESKVLMAVPTFPGERITGVSLDAYFASGVASAIDQPGELNWYGIIIPWGLVWATSLMDAGNAVQGLGTVLLIDELYVQWLRNVDDSDVEKFGGDVDADPEDKSDEEGHSNEELLDSGPIGVHKWFSREVLMQPLSAEGNAVIRFGDAFTARTKPIPAPAMGGLALFGIVRFNTDVETNFNIELDDTTSKESVGLMIAGDYTKVMAKISGDAAAKGDYIRTVLFGGDNYIETDTLKGPTGNAFVKGVFHIDSPIKRNPTI